MILMHSIWHDMTPSLLAPILQSIKLQIYSHLFLASGGCWPSPCASLWLGQTEASKLNGAT
uniref:Uncharacterized protein n=1 Tax=Arundo donax TaxID=35708 RepID=A0A0A9DK25_ARUDO